MEYVIRFLAGGVIVSLFAILGDVLRPKSVAGLFGAAPSVALATLALAFAKHSSNYVAAESRAMILGAAALGVYSFAVCQLLMRAQFSALASTLCAAAAWFITAFGLQQMMAGL
jgi:hypothetical protein